MDMRETKELAQFRQEVRGWVQANLSKAKADPFNYVGLGDKPGQDGWFKLLAQKGWLAYRWPKEFGGPGFSEPQQIVFVDELLACGAAVPAGFGLNMVGPLILQFGTPEQKRQHLPPIARHEIIWCQGYSEPNAGSDLASLQTRAIPAGDEFVVNGQKTWTSRAQEAQWIFALVRTDTTGQPQRGISFLLIDMKTPGVSIRPIRQIDGQAEFFETFFDNVRVPVKNMVGKMNEGWTMAKALLGHERVNTNANMDMPRLFGRIKRLASQYERDGQPLMKDREFRNRLAQLEMDADCLRYTRYRLLSAMMQGKAPGPESSILKLFQTDLLQDVFELAMNVLGPDSMAWYDKSLSAEAFDIPMYDAIFRAVSIYAGSNEIQRNIISKRVLGLPG
jgi:alkylation response protein AidB-like acyl-CoA dehydrogenase